MDNIFSFKNLIIQWIGFSETIAEVVQEEEF